MSEPELKLGCERKVPSAMNYKPPRESAEAMHLDSSHVEKIGKLAGLEVKGDRLVIGQMGVCYALFSEYSRSAVLDGMSDDLLEATAKRLEDEYHFARDFGAATATMVRFVHGRDWLRAFYLCAIASHEEAKAKAAAKREGEPKILCIKLPSEVGDGEHWTPHPIPEDASAAEVSEDYRRCAFALGDALINWATNTYIEDGPIELSLLEMTASELEALPDI